MPAWFLTLTFNPVTWGSKFSSGTTTSSINIEPVVDARNENFPSIFGAVSPSIPLKTKTHNSKIYSQIRPMLFRLHLNATRKVTKAFINVPITWKPVNWFAQKIIWLVSILRQLWQKTFQKFEPNLFWYIETMGDIKNPVKRSFNKALIRGSGDQGKY